MYILFQLLICAATITHCLANTEILNFQTRRNSTGVLADTFSSSATSTPVSLIPAQSLRVLIPQTDLSAVESHQNEFGTSAIYFTIQLDDYLRNQTEDRSWLCKMFAGGCSVDTDKAWTARISWPATTPTSFNLSISHKAGEHASHDRILGIDFRRSGIAIPSHSALSLFDRHGDGNKTGTLLQQQISGIASAWNLTTMKPQRDAEALVFDILVEPLLFSVLPMGSWYPAVTLIGALVLGCLVSDTVLNAFSFSDR